MNRLQAEFRHSEAGLVPHDWEVKRIGEFLKFYNGKAHEQYISRTGRFVVVNSKFVSTDGKVRKNSTKSFLSARVGDVLMVMSDLPNGRALAKCFLVDRNDFYAVNQRVCIFRSRSDDPRYLRYVLNRNPYFMAFDDGVQQTHLLNDPIKKCPVVLPPVGEQRAIADVLADAERHISILERLIAKKQMIKQGMTQQLLTGKTRLPGFNDPWRRVPIKAVAKVSRGASPRPIASDRWFDDSSAVGWVRIADLGRSDGLVLKSTTQRLSADGIARSRFLPAGTLIMSIAATVGVPIVTGIPACIHDGFVAIEQLQGVDQLYLLYTLKSLESELRSAGQTGSQANVNTEIVNRMMINLPSITEQSSIAGALRSVDEEINALRHRVAKAKAVKQGMMQELLTGRTRLQLAGVLT